MPEVGTTKMTFCPEERFPMMCKQRRVISADCGHMRRSGSFLLKYTEACDLKVSFFVTIGGGRVVRWCWVNFRCRGVLLIWIRVGQGPTALAVGAGGGCLDIFSLVYHFSFHSPSLWETARYRLKYCLKGPLSPKQPTNQFL